MKLFAHVYTCMRVLYEYIFTLRCERDCRPCKQSGPNNHNHSTILHINNLLCKKRVSNSGMILIRRPQALGYEFFYEAHINANELDIVVYLLYFIIDYLALFSRN
jgi:hypothetical protein